MKVTKAGVVGAGTMGAAIAEVLALNGIEVYLKDVDTTLVDKGLARVRGYVDSLVRFQENRVPKEIARISELVGELSDDQKAKVRAKMAPTFSRAQGDEVVARVHGTTDYGPFAEVDLVIEAVFERMEVKRPVAHRSPESTPSAHCSSSPAAPPAAAPLPSWPRSA